MIKKILVNIKKKNNKNKYKKKYLQNNNSIINLIKKKNNFNQNLFLNKIIHKITNKYKRCLTMLIKIYKKWNKNFWIIFN